MLPALPRVILLATTIALSVLTGAARAADPLPSWNEGPTKQAILDFVERTARVDSQEFVPPGERIATFDNDGTLWCEQPNYVQGVFLIDRVKLLRKEHPEWETKEPYASLLKGDLRAAIAGGEKGFAEMIMVTHAGVTTEAFETIVNDWLATARHPRFHRPYTECVYQPMLELLEYLRAEEFKTFIVTGGGIDFVRAWAERVYGIPPEQVIGSSIKAKFTERDGTFQVIRMPEVDFIDNAAGKPVGIHRFIGRRPLAAFGNSDGDLEMLQWTTAGVKDARPRFGLIVHHTDAEREYAYDRESPIGTLDKALDQAGERGWTVVDMKRDWRVIFPPPSQSESTRHSGSR